MPPKNNGIQRKSTRLDGLKWLIVLVLTIAGIGANYYYSSTAWAIRAAIGIVLLLILAAIILQTAKGQIAWDFIKGARSELRKVVWPTRQETVQTTVIVVIMVIIAALLLWAIDSLFMWLVGWLVGQGR